MRLTPRLTCLGNHFVDLSCQVAQARQFLGRERPGIRGTVNVQGTGVAIEDRRCQRRRGCECVANRLEVLRDEAVITAEDFGGRDRLLAEDRLPGQPVFEMEVTGIGLEHPFRELRGLRDLQRPPRQGRNDDRLRKGQRTFQQLQCLLEGERFVP